MNSPNVDLEHQICALNRVSCCYIARYLTSKLGWARNTPHFALTREVQAAALMRSVHVHGQEDQLLTMVMGGAPRFRAQCRVTPGAHLAWLPGNRRILLNPTLGGPQWAPITNMGGKICKV